MWYEQLRMIFDAFSVKEIKFEIFSNPISSSLSYFHIWHLLDNVLFQATVDVLPTLLKDTSFFQTLAELLALCFGVYLMVLIAAFE